MSNICMCCFQAIATVSRKDRKGNRKDKTGKPYNYGQNLFISTADPSEDRQANSH